MVADTFILVAWIYTFILVSGTNGCLDISRHTIYWMWIGTMRLFSLEWHYWVFED